MKQDKTIADIKVAKAKFDLYDGKVWDKDGFPELNIAGFDKQTGGYVVTHKGHRFDIKTGDFEKRTAGVLMRNGYQVEFMDESAYGRKQYDVRVNGVPTEIKVMEGYRNIRKRAEMASEQGASRVVFYIGFDDNIAMFKRFRNVHRTVNGIKEIWFVKNGKLHYYIDK